MTSRSVSWAEVADRLRPHRAMLWRLDDYDGSQARWRLDDYDGSQARWRLDDYDGSQARWRLE